MKNSVTVTTTIPVGAEESRKELQALMGPGLGKSDHERLSWIW